MTDRLVGTTANNGIARITIDHPPLNILTRAVLAQMRDVLGSLAAQPDLRVAVLGAAGKHFSAGADVGEHLPPDFHDMIPEFLDTIAVLDEFPVPVVAAVQGRCLGGGFELIQAADIVLAGEGAVFGQPELLLGVLPPAACVFLPELCPQGVARDIVFTGDPISAAEAHAIGLVRRVVPDDRLATEAQALAERIARHSAAALRHAKRAFPSRRRHMLEAAGRLYVDELMTTQDAVEGLTAFQEKRNPRWSHR